LSQGLYFHIPFCKSRCTYCDFYSTTQLPLRQRYAEALAVEISQRANGLPVRTIYFGGGTPSQLTFSQLQTIFSAIFQHFSVENDAEITLEANPDDVTPDFLSQLRQLPVNRLSMGVQTFNDQQLALLRRRHTAQQAVDAVKRAQQAGFSNISIDLIYGFPEQTLADWQHNVSQAVALGVQHISAYALMYEDGTPLTQQLRDGQISEIDDERSWEMFCTLCETLERAGFEHYEISNFCLPGRASRHNSSYWDGTPYLGFGAAAHSFDGRCRSWNVADLQRYIAAMEQGRGATEATETLSPDQRYNEFVMTRLRTRNGLDLNALRREFGEEKLRYCQRAAQAHLARGLLQQSGETLVLTRQGIFVSNDIMSDLMVDVDE